MELRLSSKIAKLDGEGTRQYKANREEGTAAFQRGSSSVFSRLNGSADDAEYEEGEWTEEPVHHRSESVWDRLR